MAEKINLPGFVRGDTWSNKISLGSDITGYTFWLTLKLDPTTDDSEAAAQVMVVASGADALAGDVFLTLTAAQTEALLPTQYQYDIQYAVGDAVRTICYGSVGPIIGDITRSR